MEVKCYKTYSENLQREVECKTCGNQGRGGWCSQARTEKERNESIEFIHVKI